MNRIQTTSGEAAVVKILGRFTFEMHKDFRASFDLQLAGKNDTITIDFDAVDYIDSAALGMLLLARERASALGKQVELVNCRGPVKAVLDIANFQKLFKIR